MDDKLKLSVIGTQVCTATDDLYQLVDFLNRNLKDKGVIFGLSKHQEEEGKMLLTLYRA
ncbi:YpmA family protein [Alicyclobacillus pomorum]|jgi:hypothetical protein|uniref:YpmA family protein n=1 Tax=Alicyclobacillus pomorum TaxID=204470 RepID=UPI000419ED36|nr:YpmA family protein [Alicyclobacillus pomorum]